MPPSSAALPRPMSADEASARSVTIVLALGCALLAGLIAFFAARATPDALFLKSGIDKFLDNDSFRVIENLSRVDSNHYRTKVHPLFSLIGYPSFKAVQALTGGSARAAFNTFTALIAALNAALTFTLFRHWTQRPAFAAAMTLLAIASAPWLVWHAVPETYPLGYLSLVLAALLLTRPVVSGFTVGAAVLASISITVTNVMVGLAGAAMRLKWRAVAPAVAGGVAVAAGLAIMQSRLFPTAWQFFRRSAVQEEYTFINLDPARWPGRLFEMLYQSLVAGRPTLDVKEHVVFSSLVGPISELEMARLALIGVWLALLGFGLARAVGRARSDPLIALALVSLAGQIALHLVYGPLVFLYLLHYLPWLLVLAACALERMPERSAVIATLLIACATGVVNYATLLQAFALV